jgi:hypothetical protein
MKTQQPKWSCIANLGDSDPINYGGAFVYIDLTGVYAPELEILEEPCFGGFDDKPQTDWTVYRICLEPHTFTAENENGERVNCNPHSAKGVLSDNQFHKDYPVWYAKDLDGICNSVGAVSADLIMRFCSEDAVVRALAYLNVIGYYGAHEFDLYPLNLGRNASRVAFRYRSELKRLREHRTWETGYLKTSQQGKSYRIENARGELLSGRFHGTKTSARQYAKDHGIALIEKA